MFKKTKFACEVNRIRRWRRVVKFFSALLLDKKLIYPLGVIIIPPASVKRLIFNCSIRLYIAFIAAIKSSSVRKDDDLLDTIVTLTFRVICRLPFEVIARECTQTHDAGYYYHRQGRCWRLVNNKVLYKKGCGRIFIVSKTCCRHAWFITMPLGIRQNSVAVDTKVSDYFFLSRWQWFQLKDLKALTKLDSNDVPMCLRNSPLDECKWSFVKLIHSKVSRFMNFASQSVPGKR